MSTSARAPKTTNGAVVRKTMALLTITRTGPERARARGMRPARPSVSRIALRIPTHWRLRSAWTLCCGPFRRKRKLEWSPPGWPAKERSPRRKPWDKTRKQSSSEGAKDPPRSGQRSQHRELERIRTNPTSRSRDPGAMAGNWRDLRTIFEFAGITEPSKEATTASELAASEPR